MASYDVGYRMDWKTYLDESPMTLLIHDTTSGTPGNVANYTRLIAGGQDPVQISVIDNDEAKLTPQRAKRCTINYLSSSGVPFYTFASGHDEKYLVELLAGDDQVAVFTGFLVLDDNNAAFLHENANFTITLTATDNLKTLSKVPLVDSNGDNPRGNYTLMDFLVMCFQKTGLFLPIKVYCSLMEAGNGIMSTSAIFDGTNQWISVPENTDNIHYFRAGKDIVISGTSLNNGTSTITSVTNPGGNLLVTLSVTIVTETPGTILFTDVNPCILSNLYLDARTFEKAINESEDSNTVLTKILSAFGLFVEQKDGYWWIIGVDEIKWTPLKIFVFDENGAIVSWGDLVLDYKEIGKGYDIYFRDAAAQVRVERAKLYTKRIYKYEPWLELVCNNDMDRGTFIADLADVTEDDITYQRKSNEFECWTYIKRNPSTGAFETQDSDSYVVRYFYNGYEKQRFLRLAQTVTDHIYYQQLNDRIPIQAKDKFVFSFNWRYSNDLTSGPSSGLYIFQQAAIRLYGDDGTYWNVKHVHGNVPPADRPQWFQSNSTWSSGQEFIEDTGLLEEEDFTQWRAASTEIPPAPVSGDIEIILIHQTIPNTVDKDFSSIRFEYLPFINGSYGKITGEYDKFFSTAARKDNFEQTAYISGGVRKVFKGALKYFNGDDLTDETQYFLATDFYNYSEGRGNGFGYDRLGKWVANIFWNQYRNETSVFTGHLQGLETTPKSPDCPDMVHGYLIKDSDPMSNTRVFMLVTLPRQNFRTCYWEATLSEVYNFGIDPPLTEYDNDKYEFKYLTT